MDKPRFFRFAYLSHQKEDRSLLPHQVRDGDAFAELSPLLVSRGWEYGGLLLNYPIGIREDASEIIADTLCPADLLVLTTRPPLNDRKHKEKKVVTPSGTWLEKKIFAEMYEYFRHCSRQEVALQEQLAAHLPEKYANRAILNFYTRAEASYKTAIAHKGLGNYAPWDELNTAAYFIHTPSLWEGGPCLLTAFGMSGTIGLIWAHLIRRRFPHLLDGPRFVMAEITRDGALPEAPVNLSFANHWEVNFILDNKVVRPSSRHKGFGTKHTPGAN